ncbi:hypothetical protein CCYN2B_280034 [Capnocytophaga cynodegmi]|uniref:Uncharacterized protein n=1 Tax=Capnocytophaga cynodegmi TaxID=28189 RepID=A0A0B7H8U2_9FLAO|nr:hypothetical protein CCYN2B_280034 [Capnocytophaga cynodegmi]
MTKRPKRFDYAQRDRRFISVNLVKNNSFQKIVLITLQMVAKIQ